MADTKYYHAVETSQGYILVERSGNEAYYSLVDHDFKVTSSDILFVKGMDMDRVEELIANAAGIEITGPADFEHIIERISDMAGVNENNVYDMIMEQIG